MVVIAGIIKGMKSSLSLCQTWLKACLRNFIPKRSLKITWFQTRVRSFQCLARKPVRIVKHVPPQWRRFSIRLSSIYNVSWAGALFPQISYLRVNSFHFLYTVSIDRKDVCHMFMLRLRVLDPWRPHNLVNLLRRLWDHFITLTC